MKIERCIKPAFSVMGKEGSTQQGQGFIQKLWAEADAHFDEVGALVKRDEQGNLSGIWGAMTDFSRSFMPWEENFSKGLYLAGFECGDEVCTPEGWTKWRVPGYEYICAELECGDTFSQVLDYMKANGLPLAGAVQDFSNPADGKNYMLFPIRRI